MSINFALKEGLSKALSPLHSATPESRRSRWRVRVGHTYPLTLVFLKFHPNICAKFPIAVIEQLCYIDYRKSKKQKKYFRIDANLIAANQLFGHTPDIGKFFSKILHYSTRFDKI